MNSLVSTVLCKHALVNSMTRKHKFTCKDVSHINFFNDGIYFLFEISTIWKLLLLKAYCNPAKKLKEYVFVKEHLIFLATLVNFKHCT